MKDSTRDKLVKALNMYRTKAKIAFVKNRKKLN